MSIDPETLVSLMRASAQASELARRMASPELSSQVSEMTRRLLSPESTERLTYPTDLVALVEVSDLPDEGGAANEFDESLDAVLRSTESADLTDASVDPGALPAFDREVIASYVATVSVLLFVWAWLAYPEVTGAVLDHTQFLAWGYVLCKLVKRSLRGNAPEAT